MTFEAHVEVPQRGGASHFKATSKPMHNQSKGSSKAIELPPKALALHFKASMAANAWALHKFMQACSTIPAQGC